MASSARAWPHMKISKAAKRRSGHVFTLSAEREGLRRLALLEKLLVMWRGQDGAVRALGDLLAEVETRSLPHHRIGPAIRSLGPARDILGEFRDRP